MLPVPLCQTTVRRERRLHNSLSRNFHHVLVCIGPWLAARIRVPIEINRARLIYQYVPVFFKLAHLLQRIFRAFWVHIDVHNNYFYFANKSYFRKIMGVKFKKTRISTKTKTFIFTENAERNKRRDLCTAVMSVIASKFVYFELLPVFYRCRKIILFQTII